MNKANHHTNIYLIYITQQPLSLSNRSDYSENKDEGQYE